MNAILNLVWRRARPDACTNRRNGVTSWRRLCGRDKRKGPIASVMTRAVAQTAVHFNIIMQSTKWRLKWPPWHTLKIRPRVTPHIATQLGMSLPNVKGKRDGKGAKSNRWKWRQIGRKLSGIRILTLVQMRFTQDFCVFIYNIWYHSKGHIIVVSLT